MSDCAGGFWPMLTWGEGTIFLFIWHVAQTSMAMADQVEDISHLFLRFIIQGDPKKVYLFLGFQGEHRCLQNSYIEIFLDSQRKSDNFGPILSKISLTENRYL